MGGNAQALRCAKGEVHPLQLLLLRRQYLLRLDRRPTLHNRTAIGFPRRDVPAPGEAVEGMSGWTEPHVGPARPVGRVVARAKPILSGVGHLIERKARGREL